MANYTPTDQFDFNNIPLTGVLIPGATVGYVTESKYVKGGYIVVQTLDERDALLDKSLYEDKELETGTPVFVASEGKTYRYMGSEGLPWTEDTTGTDIETLKDNVDDLQKIVLSQKSEIDSKVSNEDFDNLTSSIDENFNNVRAQLVQLSADVSKKADEEQFVNVTFDLLSKVTNLENTKANAEDVYTKTEVDEKLLYQDKWDDNRLTLFEVGGLKKDSDLRGKSIKDILKMIVYGDIVEEPKFDSLPTVKNVKIENTIGISSNPLTIKGSISFDRGEITLGGKHQGYLAGTLDSVVIKNTVTGIEKKFAVTPIGSGREQTASFEYTLDAIALNETIMEIKIGYLQGDQARDSTGDLVTNITNADGTIIECPYPAGFSNPVQFTVTGLTNTWTSLENDPDGGTMQQIDEEIITDSSEASINKSGMFQEFDENGNVIAAGYQLTADASIYSSDFSKIYNPIVLISEGNKIIGIKGWDELKTEWDWYRGDTAEESLQAWIASGTTTRSYNDQTINYTIYKHDGVLGKPLQFRFYIA